MSLLADEAARAVEYRRMMTARARWECARAHSHFPGSKAAYVASYAATSALRRDDGWDPPVDCTDDPDGLQVP